MDIQKLNELREVMIELKDLPPAKLYMGTWGTATFSYDECVKINADYNYEPTYIECTSAGCLLGWAALSDKFPDIRAKWYAEHVEEGRWDDRNLDMSVEYLGSNLIHHETGKGPADLYAGQLAFDLTLIQTYALFLPQSYRNPRDITIDDVVQRIDDVIKYGDDMSSYEDMVGVRGQLKIDAVQRDVMMTKDEFAHEYGVVQDE